MMKVIAECLVVVGLLNTSVAGAAPVKTREGMESLGVVVEEVGKGSVLEKAGLQPGDVLYSWTRLANLSANSEVTFGEITDPFDWLDLVTEQAPRGTVVLAGERGGNPNEIMVGPGLWEAQIRPILQPALEEAFLKGKNYLVYGDVQAASREWRPLTETSKSDNSKNLHAWTQFQIGKAWGVQHDWEQALKAFRQALEVTADSDARVLVWQAIGEAHEMLNEFDAAQDAYTSALIMQQENNSESLGISSSLIQLGELAWARGDLTLAYEHTLQALQIQEYLAPQSLATVAGLNNLGVIVKSRGELARAHDYFIRVLSILEKIVPLGLDMASCLNNLGVIDFEYGELDRANNYHLQALDIRERLAPNSRDLASSLNNLGAIAEVRGELDRAFEYYSRNLRMLKQLAPQSLEMGGSLSGLGAVAKARGELDLARDYILQALRIREKIAPESLIVAKSLLNLGAITHSRGELDLSYDYYLQALQIQRQLAPQSLSLADRLTALGTISETHGNLNLAYDYYAQALQIRENIAPNSLALADSLNRLGIVTQAKGELDIAHDYFLHVLHILERSNPNSSEMAAILNNLGTVALDRKDFNRAHDYYTQALKIQEAIYPETSLVADILNNLGGVARAQGQLDLANDYFIQTLSIYEKIAPRSTDVALVLNNIAAVAQNRKDLDRARSLYLRSLNISENLAPQSIPKAFALRNLGFLSKTRGDLNLAQSYIIRAIKIYELLAPNSHLMSIALNDLGDIARENGKSFRALEYYNRALEVLEHQVYRLGGSYDIRAGFRAQIEKYYRDPLEMLLAESRFVEAFHLMERFRAQTFLTMLTERDKVFSPNISGSFDLEKRQLSANYDRTMKRLSGLNPQADKTEIEGIRKELARLNDEAGDLEARIRFASPHLAALQYPHPLNLAGAREALDRGTLLLSYSVSEETTTLFTFSGNQNDLQVTTIPLGKDAIRTQVESLRRLIKEAVPGSSLTEARLAQLRTASRDIYETLLEPVAKRIEESERLLILPDGPLHNLPFAALVRTSAAERNDQYLVEWKPIHVALSATVYAELQERRRPEYDGNITQDPVQLVAIGDPLYPERFTSFESGPRIEIYETNIASDDSEPHSAANVDRANAPRGDPIVRSVAERGGFSWQRLPYTRQEVEGIAKLFPQGSVRTLLGPEALEEKIKSLDPETRILHIAAHGHTDKNLPSSSFVALTIPEDPGPEQDNGLLQVREIFERVRIDADLVVLSACETGLGQERGSEGLISLTRAFQYAGARSVVASLWNIADQATAELMVRFYRHLRSGLSKDEALRAAQIEFIRRPIEVTAVDGEKVMRDASAPYYWAAFQIYGDWQ